MSGCPVKGCTRSPRRGHLMCYRHWMAVPRELQQLVRDTWRAWMHVPQQPEDAYFEARRKYLAAAEEATNAVEQAESALCE